MDLQVPLIPIFGSFAAVGLTWIFQPLFSAVFASDLQWEYKTIGEKHSNCSTPLVSIVIPAFDEEERLPKMLRESHEFLRTERGQALIVQLKNCSKSIYPEIDTTTRCIEWVIVNDGSRDETVRVAETTVLEMQSPDSWGIVTLSTNSGKGAAVKTGMLQANGVFRVMADADGATSFGPGLENLVHELERQILGVKDHRGARMLAVFGSRANLQNDASIKRSLVRTMLMHAFHFFVGILVSSRIKDTQCGFKLFTKTTASLIFSTLHLHRWAFDTEVVLISEEASITLLEVDVPWREIDGSKLNTSRFALAVNSMCMLRDMICVRLCYLTGVWKIATKTDS